MWTYVRAFCFAAPLIVVATALLGTVSFLTTLFDRSGRAAHRVARLWSRVLLAVAGVKAEVEGLERIAPNGSYVIASNHLSLMDTPLVLAHLPLQFRFLAKKSLFRIPFIGTHLRRAGHVSIPREDARGSLKAMAEAARLLRERGISMLVFPEGTRSTGELGAFKEGAAYLAIQAGVPLVPVAIAGTGTILPPGSVILRPGPVRMRVGQPIPTGGLTLQDRTRLTALLRERIQEMLRRPAGLVAGGGFEPPTFGL
ncbi:MAG: lysophospholipid acyltransferase family protein [Bryobacterales bacterium]|nr:1-acyl-sn-glycerol-3-phosphate acyltransferase [Bryobacteraceae bacterium]MDW8354445.1 lysophospholipid acyltransferase family protein [Bryobacterales bacterium]